MIVRIGKKVRRLPRVPVVASPWAKKSAQMYPFRQPQAVQCLQFQREPLTLLQGLSRLSPSLNPHHSWQTDGYIEFVHYYVSFGSLVKC